MNVVVDTFTGPLIYSNAEDVAIGDHGELLVKRGGVTEVIHAPGHWSSVRLSDETNADNLQTPEQMLIEFHSVFPTPNDDALRLRLIDEEVQELREALAEVNTVEIADAIADIVYVAVGTAIVKGIPFDKVFSEVHRSNMTKLGADGKPVKRADGKIKKGPNYEPPRIRAILYNEGVI